MVLHHVAERAAGFVIRSALLDAERLGGGDLDVVDVAVVPERLEDRVGKAQHHDVLRGFLPEIVVDAIRVLFAEDAGDHFVERVRRREIGAEGLLHDHARPCTGLRGVQPGGGDLREDAFVFRRRDGEVEEPVAARAALRVERVELCGEGGVAGGVAEFADVIENARGETSPDLLVQTRARALRRRLLEFRAPGLVRLLAAGEADDVRGGGQVAIDGEIVERRDELAEGEVARGAEDHDVAGLRHGPAGEALAQRVGGCRDGRIQSGAVYKAWGKRGK